MVAPDSPTVPHRSRRRWVVVAGAIAVALLVVVAYVVFVRAPHSSTSSSGGPPGTTPPGGGGGGTPHGGRINILPSPGTGSICITGTPGVPRPILGLSLGALQANTYDVPSGTTGHVGMCYDSASGSMFGYANWSHVGGDGGWFSYPQVTYGVNEWAGAESTYTNQSSVWELPQTVSSVTDQNIWFTTSYSLAPPGSADATGYDLSLDEFLTESVPPEFEVGPFVEVELFLAHNISYPFHWIHWEMETLVNSTLETEPWDVAYWCHGLDNGSNANVSFDLSYGGQSTHGLFQGTLGVNLSAVMAEVESLMPGVGCWTGPTGGFGGFYWDEANLGSEDGAIGGASFNYNWTVNDYCIDRIVAAPSPSDVECT